MNTECVSIEILLMNESIFYQIQCIFYAMHIHFVSLVYFLFVFHILKSIWLILWPTNHTGVITLSNAMYIYISILLCNIQTYIVNSFTC